MKSIILFIIVSQLLSIMCWSKGWSVTETTAYDYTICDEGVIINKYRGSDKFVILPKEIEHSPVVRIANHAFYRSNVRMILLSNGIRSIGTEAFAESALERIYLPESLKVIGDAAFSHTMLTRITLPKSLEILGDSAFYGCLYLSDVEILSSLSQIPECCFFENESLQSISIPRGIISLGSRCFYGCIDLIDIVLPDTIKMVGDEVFNSCFVLHDLYIPEGCERLGESCFGDCYCLTDVYIPSTIIVDEVWNEFLFLRCNQLCLHIHQNDDVIQYAVHHQIEYVYN